MCPWSSEEEYGQVLGLVGQVLGPGLEGQVLGPGLGLVGQVLGPGLERQVLGLEGQVLSPGLEGQVLGPGLVNITGYSKCYREHCIPATWLPLVDARQLV